MTKAATNKTAAGEAFSLPLADVGDAMAANRAMMDEAVAVNHEVAAFVGKRLRADVETFARLCRCRDWPEAMAAQVEFMSRLAEDYFEETGKLMERAARMMEQGPTRKAAEKVKTAKKNALASFSRR